MNFALQRSSRAKPFVVHVDKLKKYYGATPPSWLQAEVGVPEVWCNDSNPDEVGPKGNNADEKVQTRTCDKDADWGRATVGL